MRKGVWIGGALGLLVLVVLGSAWLARQGGHSGANMPSRPAGAPRPAMAPSSSPGASLPGYTQATGAAVDRSEKGAPALTSPLSPDVRRKRLSEVRSELSAVMAQGSQASPAQVRALLDELELLTQGSLDPRYFQALRDMLEGSGKMQELNRELQRLASSTDPKDVARRQAISVELRVLSERISAAAANVQAYAHSPAVQGKAP